MRLLIQRSKKSSVEINGKINGSIDFGYVIFVGFTHKDTKEIVNRMINKLLNLRIFEDEEGKINKSLLDVGGSILSISQFTLYANTSKGNRPSFIDSMNYDDASKLYDYFNETLKENGINTQTGIFGEDMKVSILNDGPITIMLDSNNI